MKEGFIRIPEYADDYDLSQAAKLLLGVMFELQRRNHLSCINMTQSSLGELMRVTRKTVAKYLKELIDAGLIVAKAVGRHCKYYWITAPEPEQFYMLPDSIFNDDDFTNREKIIAAKEISRANLSLANGRTTFENSKEAVYAFTIKTVMEQGFVGRTTAIQALKKIVAKKICDKLIMGLKRPCMWFMDMLKYPIRKKVFAHTAYEEIEDISFDDEIINLSKEEIRDNRDDGNRVQKLHIKNNNEFRKNKHLCSLCSIIKPEAAGLSLMQFLGKCLMCKKRTQNRYNIAGKKRIKCNIYNIILYIKGFAVRKKKKKRQGVRGDPPSG